MSSSKDLAVKVRGLSKSYTIAHNAQRHTTAAEALIHRLKNPLQKPETETFWALKDIEFDINKGDVVGIIGRNGAGKSTLLKILSRITEPTTGQIDLYGRVGSLLEVGTGFHPELTGRENVFLNGAILGMSKREIARQFDAIVDFAGVEQFLDTPVKRYSSGMYVRLAFSVAAHLNPEILIVDEVLAVGDAEFQKKCLGKMQDVSEQEGKTVLFVSHNMGAVRRLCRTALWLSHGTVCAMNNATDIIDVYMRSTLDDAESEIILTDIARRGEYGQRLRFTRVVFNNTKPAMHGERLSVHIEYEALFKVDDFGIGLAFSTVDGARILSIDSDLRDERIAEVAPGKHCVEVVVDTLHLQPGRYTLDLAARSGDDSTIDYLTTFAQIDVLPGPTTPPVMVRSESGCVRQPATWSSPPIASSKNTDNVF